VRGDCWIVSTLALVGVLLLLAAQDDHSSRCAMADDRVAAPIDAENFELTSTEHDLAAKLLPGGPTERDFPKLHNLLQVTDRLFSGAEPVDEQAFAELARLGIRTIVSVDGIRPNTAAAARHGLRYIHIPVGYDGISEQAAGSLTRLVREIEGRIYIHCHHGEHRGPAAAAIACVADGAADGAAAIVVMQRAGTSPNYAGLWRDVAAYTPPALGESLPQLTESAEVESLVEAMAQIGRVSDHLKLCQTAAWQSPPNHPDLTPLQQAILLKEAYREINRRLQDDNPHDERFRSWMRAAEKTANDLELALQQGQRDLASDLFQAGQTECRRCHIQYRD
jgi:protein tyrosine phosphatase (PTP) superfamily phosphohydrolase (DUF442 family)